MNVFPSQSAPFNRRGCIDASTYRKALVWAAAATLALLALCAHQPLAAQTCSSMALGNGASLNGFVPFPATNAWNTNIASAPVDSNSPTITAAAGFAGLHLHPDFGSEAYYGIPYVVVDSSTQPNVPINVIDYASESDVLLAPYPGTAPIEGLPGDCYGWPDSYIGDSHVLVLDRAKCTLYETFNTHRCRGQWASSSETIWDMTNGESRPWGWTSADAAGLAIFPGLIRYDEVATGAIHHAIRFTMEHTKNDANDGYFVPPASHAAGTDWGVSNVMGMRIRLKASYDISGYSATNQVILTAMKQYGMILADNGGYFFFQGASDPRWDDNDLVNLENVGSENFEVVQMTPEFPGWDSATAPTGTLPSIGSFTASATSVAAGAPVTFTYTATGDSYDFIDLIGPVPASGGSVTIHPKVTETYTLNSTNAFGRTASKPITVTVPGSVVAPPVFNPPGGAYRSALTVTLASATSLNATIHYTTDGSTPSTRSPVFSIANPITVSKSQKLQAIATVGGYSAASAVAAATYTLLAPVDTPVFSLKAGTYPAEQVLALTDATKGAIIYYTTNRTVPTTSSARYTAPITIETSETVEAMATSAGLDQSAVEGAEYSIVGSPTALAAPATAVTASSATLNATIDTRGLAGSYKFQYGASSTALTAATPAVALGASTNSIAASVKLSGLKGKSTYYYRILVTTAGGTATGAVLSFATQ